MSVTTKERNRLGTKLFRERAREKLKNTELERDNLVNDNIVQYENLISLSGENDELQANLVYVRTFVEHLLRLTITNK